MVSKMNDQSKLKQNRIFRIIFLLCLCIIVANINFQSENDSLLNLDKPNTSDGPLYHLEWAQIGSSAGAYEMVMSSSEDLYTVSTNIVAKHNKNGDLLWDEYQAGYFYSIALDSSNNVYIAGRTSNYDMILVKFSSSGTFQWSKTHSTRDSDIAYAVTVDSSNNVYIGGISYFSGSWGNKDALLVKFSSSGTFIWERFLDLRDEDYIKGLTTDSSNNVYLTGHHRLYSTSDDVFIAKYSSSGVFQWSKNWGSFYDEESYDIALDSANNIYITGFAKDPTTHEDLLLIKYNSAGNLQWTREWAGYGLDRGYSIELSSDGDIFISGATYEQSAGLFDILLMVYDSAGTMKWWGRWGGPNHDTGGGIAVNSAKQVYIGGSQSNSLCILKYEPAPRIVINDPSPNSLHSSTAPSFNVDITDSNLIEKYYTVNDGSQYIFTGSTGNINQAAWDSCPHGAVSLKFYGRDFAGSVYDEVIVRKDILAPDFEIASPTTYQVCTDIAPNYQLTTSDTDVNTIWYTLNGGGNIMASSLTGQIDQTAWGNLDNGSVNIEFFMEDDIGNIASKEVEVYKNYEIPLVSVNSPFPNHFCGIKAPSYSISIFSLWPINEIWYSLNYGQNISTTETDGIINQTEWDLYGNGTVTINFYANNSLGNVGNAEVTVRKDIYFPFIDIYDPIANQKYGISAPNYNASITSVNLDSKWYSLNYGEDIKFLGDIGVIEQTTWQSCGNGTVIITFYANNTDGITNSKEFSIFKDIQCPNITILTPITTIFYGIETLDFSLSIEESQLDKTWYSLNGGMNYSFVGISGTIDQAAWDSCGNGTVITRFYANNTLGNIGSAEITIQKDVFFPFITIISPESEQWYGNESPNYNISVSTLDIDSMWYSLNSGINNSIFSTFEAIDQLYWEIFGNENVTITFYVNNSYGQLNFKSVKVRKDISTPNITIISPHQYDLFGIEAIEFNVTIVDPTLDTAWYTLNGGTKCFFTGNYGYIDEIAWDACGNGTVIINFFANNSLGNIESEEVIVHRDIYYPFMEIIAPVPNQYCGSIAPAFNFTVSTLALDTLWYTINESAPNIINMSEGSLDQEVWNLFGEGNLHLKFWANNTYGQTNFEEIIVSKTTHLIQKNAYAIVIGISNYPGSSYDLRYCDDDADEVYNMLINDYNFLPENIILLKDGSATKSGIDSAFATINSKINPNDIFYFYYSGHGGSELVTSSPSTLYIQSPHLYPNNYDRTWWISSTNAAYMRVHFETLSLESNWDYLYLGDAEIDDFYYQALTGYGTNFWSEWIPVLNDNKLYINLMTDSSVTDWGFRIDQIQVMRYSDPHYLNPYDSIPSSSSKNYLDSLLDSKLDSLNCKNIYTIIDACNSGGLIPEVQDTGRLIITACKGGQTSYEDPDLQNGVFTYYLLNSLDNANDQNSDGVISLEESFSYISSGTMSYSASYGPGYQYHPQISDGIAGQAVLYPSIGSVYTNPVDNKLYYSFYMYGHGTLKTLNLTVCSLSPTITYTTEEIKHQYISPTGFGYYEGVIELEEGYIAGGIRLLAEVEGYGLVKIDLRYGDSDGDGLTDFFEILDGNGLNPSSNDTDGDGLLDGEEINNFNTDPLNPDSDSDGLLDGDEVNIHGSNPLLVDSDADGLNDYDEVFLYFTYPMLPDSDADGLNDYDEIFIYFTDPRNLDTDSDLVNDWSEINVYFTDPLNSDTDSDGLLDGEEVYLHFTNPILEDTDSDGVNDYEEVNVYSTDPLNNDSDSDTMPDGWEIFNLLNPLLNDTALDPDNDTLSNILEYQYNCYAFNNDTDSDFLLDGHEVFLYGTNPVLNDTDSDGLSDYDEVMIYFTDPLQTDSDSDGISDYDEIHTHGTNPLDADTDSDSMPDGWEINNLLNPFTNDTALDPDNDFLTNIEEFQHGTLAMNNDTDSDGLLDGEEVFTYITNPNIADTDFDGLLDGEEVDLYLTDPLDNDTDSDGLLDGVEVNVHNTDPLSGDTDSDTMPDKWEIDYSLNPLVNDTMLDPDNDDLVNILEYQHNTNPQNPDTDYDGWTDGEEVLVHGTDPLDPNDHPTPPTSPLAAIPGYHIIIVISIVGWISLVLVRKKKFKLV